MKNVNGWDSHVPRTFHRLYRHWRHTFYAPMCASFQQKGDHDVQAPMVTSHFEGPVGSGRFQSVPVGSGRTRSVPVGSGRP